VKTYVAEIKGEAVVAFRAENDDMAYEIVNEKDDGMQLGLSGSLSADGSPLWDKKSEITARPATEAEQDLWLKARDAEIGDASEGHQVDPRMGHDPDDFVVYLVPISLDDEDDESE
jgi:hypothetical protein